MKAVLCKEGNQQCSGEFMLQEEACVIVGKCWTSAILCVARVTPALTGCLSQI